MVRVLSNENIDVGKRRATKKASSILESFANNIMLVLIVLAVITRLFFFTPVKVDGDSMMGTLHDGDILLVDKVQDIHRGDIVVFDAPDKKGEEYIKRVIGVSGDTVAVVNNELYINDVKFTESYLDSETVTEDFTLFSKTGKTVIPEGYYFVLGDNRTNSNDSRSFGLVKEEKIVGLVTMGIFPFKFEID